MSATASLGLVMLWDVDEGINTFEPFVNHSSEPYIRAGALLGMGVLSSGVRNESDVALAVLSEYVLLYRVKGFMSYRSLSWLSY